MNESIQGLLAQVVGYYRSPLNYPGFTLISNPLPDALLELLEMVNESGRTGSRLLENAQQLKIPVDELSQAIFFYIKQVLFAPGADYYRTLGLSRDVSSDEIRHHYRLLIRLFHPDRNPQGEIWDDQYAIRINEAYNTLKRPEKRDAYDNRSGADRQVPQERAKQSGQPVRSQQSEQPAKFSGSLLQQLWGSYLWQRHPKALVVGIVGSGMLLVLLLAAMSGNDSAFEITQSIDVFPVTDLNEHPADERRAAFMRAIGSNTPAQVDRAVEMPARRSDADKHAAVETEGSDQQILQQIDLQLATQKAASLENESIGPGASGETAGFPAAASVSPIPLEAPTPLPVEAEAVDKPAAESTIAASERAGEQAIAQMLAANTLQMKSSMPAKKADTSKPVYVAPVEVYTEPSRLNAQLIERVEVSRPKSTQTDLKAGVKADPEAKKIPDQVLSEKIVVMGSATKQDVAQEVSEEKVTEEKTRASELETKPSNGQENAGIQVSNAPIAPKPKTLAQSTPAFIARTELLAQSDELLLKYIAYYEAGNLLGILDLFTPTAIVNGRRGIEHVATKFNVSFHSAQKRRVELHKFKSTQTGSGEVVVDVQAGFLEFDEHGDLSEQYEVNLKLYLVETNKRLLIAQQTQINRQDMQ